MDDGKYAEARGAFERSIRTNPQFAPAHTNLGNAFVALKLEGAVFQEFLARHRYRAERRRGFI
jgi:hypothetical protein